MLEMVKRRNHMTVGMGGEESVIGPERIFLVVQGGGFG